MADLSAPEVNASQEDAPVQTHKTHKPILSAALTIDKHGVFGLVGDKLSAGETFLISGRQESIAILTFVTAVPIGETRAIDAFSFSLDHLQQLSGFVSTDAVIYKYGRKRFDSKTGTETRILTVTGVFVSDNNAKTHINAEFKKCKDLDLGAFGCMVKKKEGNGYAHVLYESVIEENVPFFGDNSVPAQVPYLLVVRASTEAAFGSGCKYGSNVVSLQRPNNKHNDEKEKNENKNKKNKKNNKNKKKKKKNKNKDKNTDQTVDN